MKEDEKKWWLFRVGRLYQHLVCASRALQFNRSPSNPIHLFGYYANDISFTPLRHEVCVDSVRTSHKAPTPIRLRRLLGRTDFDGPALFSCTYDSLQPPRRIPSHCVAPRFSLLLPRGIRARPPLNTTRSGSTPVVAERSIGL